jgi:hypothetical protein
MTGLPILRPASWARGEEKEVRGGSIPVQFSITITITHHQQDGTTRRMRRIPMI